MLKYKDKFFAALTAALLCVTVLAILICAFDIKIFEHNPYDSYTRQALAWQEGKTYLDDNPAEISYLELAVFDGKYYVSFPPVPSVIEFVMTLFFGQDTPNRLMLFVYIVISCVALTLMFLKKFSSITSLVLGLTASIGTNLLSIATFAGVWHEAQCLSFMLCSLAALFIFSDSKKLNGLSLFLAALAVGCRPFTVIFIPFLLYEIYRKNNFRKITQLWPYIIAPAVVAFLLMLYNYIRFRNPLEFGHNYLPEFTRAEEGQFSFSYLLPNLIQSIKLPYASSPEMHFEINKFSANIFYIFNPIIAVFMYYNFKNCIIKRKLYDCLFFIAVLIFIFATCMHKTLGGAQFGARYYLDMIPFLAMYLAMQKINIKYEAVRLGICLFSIAINIYGVYFVIDIFM